MESIKLISFSDGDNRNKILVITEKSSYFMKRVDYRHISKIEWFTTRLGLNCAIFNYT